MRIHRHKLVLALLAAGLFIASGVSAQIQLPAGTEVQIVFDQGVSSGSAKVGDIVAFHLKNQIDVGGVTVVKAGCKGTAKVKAIEKAGKPGKAGKLELELVGLEPDHSYKPAGAAKITLQSTEGGTIIRKGGGKKVLSLILGFGLLIKGGEGKIDAGTELTVKVKQNIDLLVD